MEEVIDLFLTPSVDVKNEREVVIVCPKCDAAKGGDEIIPYGAFGNRAGDLDGYEIEAAALSIHCLTEGVSDDLRDGVLSGRDLSGLLYSCPRLSGVEDTKYFD